MDKATYESVVTRAANARHRQWCVAPYDDKTKTYPTCTGPKRGDIGIAKAIIRELYGPAPEE